MAVVKDLSGNRPTGAGVTDPHFSRPGYVDNSYPVTPSDTTNLPNGSTDAILVAVAGNVKVTYVGGLTDTIYLSAGAWHPMNVIRIWATGTAATGINAS